MAQTTKPAKQSAAVHILQVLEKRGIAEAKRTFTDIKNDTTQFYFSEHEFNIQGYDLINKARFKEALTLFKMNIDLFPNSTNVYDSQGEAYIFIGDTTKAIASYKMINQIDSTNFSGDAIVKNIHVEFEKHEYYKLARLHSAAKAGSLELVTSWIESNPQLVNQKSQDGNTALHLAAYSGKLEIVKYLLSEGALFDERNILGQTPYNLAQNGNLTSIMKVLENSGCDTSPQQFPVLTTRYLGQNEPGTSPTLFSPGIVSTHSQVYGNIVFSPDFTEACWTPNDGNFVQYKGGFIMTTFQNGRWTAPVGKRFLGEDYNHRSPFYSSDGKRLYFQGHLKSLEGWDQQEKFYYVEKKGKSWSKPTLLDSIFNKYKVHWQFSLDKNHSLYFGGSVRGEKNTSGIYFSRYDDGTYIEPELVFSNKDLPDHIFGPAISPEGDYMIFTRVHPRGFANPRIFSLYISFRINDQWSTPEELGKKLQMDGNQVRITHDGKYIFYLNKAQPYWISTDIIESFRP